MPRANMPAGFADAIAADGARLFFAVVLQFDDVTGRMWSGVGDRTIDGNVYKGTGDLMAVSGVEEKNEVSALGASITISSIPPMNLVRALNDSDVNSGYKNRPATIYLGVELNNAYYIDPIYRGVIDTMTFTEGNESAAIEIAIENKLTRLARPSVLRYTSEQLKAKYPTECGLEYLNALQTQARGLQWGGPGNNKIQS